MGAVPARLGEAALPVQGRVATLSRRLHGPMIRMGDLTCTIGHPQRSLAHQQRIRPDAWALGERLRGPRLSQLAIVSQIWTTWTFHP